MSNLADVLSNLANGLSNLANDPLFKPVQNAAHSTFGQVGKVGLSENRDNGQGGMCAVAITTHTPLAVVTIVRKSHFSNLPKRRMCGVLNRFEKWVIGQVGQTSARFDIRPVKV